MSPRILLAALVAAASLAIASPALAASTVTTPADNATFFYDTLAPSQIAVSGTSDAAQVDLRCAEKTGATWHFGNPLNGLAIDVVGGSFSAPSLVLPFVSDSTLCKLVAVPHNTTPADLTGLSGPNLRLLIVRDSSSGMKDNNGGTNQGVPFTHYTTAGGTTADTAYEAAGAEGLYSMYLLSSDPGELGRIFSGADSIPELDPTGPRGGIAGSDGPLTGILVDGVNAFTGPTWEDAITPSLQLVFRDYRPFPSVTVSGGLNDSSFITAEQDVVVTCSGTDPMWYRPEGNTCRALLDSGVAVGVKTIIAPAGNVVERRWTLTSTDGRAHNVALWLAHAAGTNSLPRAWKLPGDGVYATHVGGDAPAPSGGAPWIARFNSASAADGDTSEGVGAVGVSAVPNELRFVSPREVDAKYAIAVPAGGAAELRTVYVGDATQAALEADLAAAFQSGGGGRGGAGGGGGGGGGAGSGGGAVPAPTLSRTGKALLGTDGKLALGYALACPAGAASACTASIALTQSVRRAARRHARAHRSKARRPVRRAKPRVLGTLKATVPAGKTTALSLTIGRKNRAAFKVGHITMTATVSRPGAATQTLSKALPVKIAKPKPRRRAHRRR